MREILHIAAHVGGGVRRALDGLWSRHRTVAPDVRRTLVLTDRPDHPQTLPSLAELGIELHIQPAPHALHALIERADIVQIEYWNHPTLLAALTALPESVQARWVTWHHQSGTFNPVVPEGLIDALHAHVCTSPCSWSSKRLSTLGPEARSRVHHAWSSGGFPGPPPELRPRRVGARLRAGYVGSLQLAKIHPRYVDFVAPSKDQLDGAVLLVGDAHHEEHHRAREAALHAEGLLNFSGYAPNVEAHLRTFDVLLYLLNPYHYGTTENALLEAMAAGVVPIVLGNACERQIVEDGRTGFIVEDAEGVRTALSALRNEVGLLEGMGRLAAQEVRRGFDPALCADRFAEVYRTVMEQPKRPAPFRATLGAEPRMWFLRTQGFPDAFCEDGQVRVGADECLRFTLTERTKGTAQQFHRAFPADTQLARWARATAELGARDA